MSVRLATIEDEKFLVENRRHISASLMKEKISKEQIYVAESNCEIVGWARYGLFWDNESANRSCANSYIFRESVLVFPMRCELPFRVVCAGMVVIERYVNPEVQGG